MEYKYASSCMRYTKMWGSSLKYVSNNSNIKDQGHLRLFKNAIKNGMEIIANFVTCDDDSLVMRTMFLFFQMHY